MAGPFEKPVYAHRPRPVRYARRNAVGVGSIEDGGESPVCFGGGYASLRASATNRARSLDTSVRNAL